MAKRSRGPLEPEEKRRLNRSNLNKLWSIAQYITPYKWSFIFGMTCLIFSSTLLLGFPFLAGKLVDVAGGTSWEVPATGIVIDQISPIGFALISLLFLQSVFSFFRVYLFANVNERAMADLRRDLYSRMIHLPMSFFDKTRVGELISRITSDVTLLQDTFSITLAEFFRQIGTLIIGSIFLYLASPKLTLFMFATFPVLVISALIFGNFIRKLSRKTQDKLAEANVIVEESLQSVQVVKAFTNEEYENKRYSLSLKELIEVALKTARYRGAFISFIIFVLFSGIVGLMWYGATLLSNGDMTSGDLFSFVLYTAFIGGSIAGLGDLYGQLQRAIGASERVIEIISEIPEGTQGDHASPISGNIDFNGVHFSYPGRPEVEVLHDLNFSVGAGEKIALVGPSGAGKSTIVQLIMRFYQPTKGHILVDGMNNQEFDLEYYRDHIGIVPQEVILFGGTIEENISYGKPGASHEAIREAARKANALEFIDRFPDGMKTVVGERGVKLSGGQRQRIAIARAILKDPRILVLDEATSSLDAESEVLVQQALELLMQHRTSIIIAHRLSTIRKADRILVIQDGRIIESGTHDTLAEKESGLYRNLLELQFQIN